MSFALLCAPQRYIDCRNVAEECRAGVDQVVALTVGKILFGYRGGRQICRLSIEMPDPSWLNKCDRVDVEMTDRLGQVIWWSLLGAAVWDAQRLHTGMPIVLAGDVQEGKDGLGLSRVALVQAGDVGRVVPFYKRTAGIGSGKAVYQAVAAAMRSPQALVEAASAVLDATKLAEHQLLALIKDAMGVSLPSLLQLLRQMHRPQSLDEAQVAIRCVRAINAWAMACRYGALTENCPQAATWHRGDTLMVVNDIGHRLHRGGRAIALLEMSVDADAFVAELVVQLMEGKRGRVAVVAAGDAQAQVVAGEIFKRLEHAGVPVPVSWVAAGSKGALPDEGVVCGANALIERSRRAGWQAQWIVFCADSAKSSASVEYLMGDSTSLVEVRSSYGASDLMAFSLIAGGGQVHHVLGGQVCGRVQLLDRKQQKRELREAVNRGEKVVLVYADEQQVHAVRQGLRQWLGCDIAVACGPEVAAGWGAVSAGRVQVLVTTVEDFRLVPGVALVFMRGAADWAVPSLDRFATEVLANGFGGRLIADVQDSEVFGVLLPRVCEGKDLVRGELEEVAGTMAASRQRPRPPFVGVFVEAEELVLMRGLAWNYAGAGAQAEISCGAPVERQGCLI